MVELWQLYDEQGCAIKGKGAPKDEVFSEGLLHGAAHVWIWDETESGSQVLLQKRAAHTRKWPDRYDISAAGHINLDERPVITALREAREEIGIHVLSVDLKLISLQRVNVIADNGVIENEFQWVYLLRLPASTSFSLQEDEVGALKWKTLGAFKNEIFRANNEYVPHSRLYFDTVISAIEVEQSST